MESLALPWLLEHANYGVMFALLVAAGLGLPIPEDIILLAGGALIHRGSTGMVATTFVCTVGVLAGDLIIFLTARRLGRRALERPWFRSMLPKQRQIRLEALFERWGGGIVFIARHLAGIRAPVFALAGMHGMRPLAFLLWDAAALSISAPVMLALGYLLSDHLDRALNGVARVEHLLVFAAGFGLAAYALHVVVRRVIRWKKR